MDIGAAVREGRKSVGLTQDDLACRAGLSRRAVILLEQNGGRVDSLEAVARVLGLRLTGLAAGPTIGDQVAKSRKRRKTTQAALADAAGLSVPTLRDIERGGGLVSSLSAVIAVLAPSARRRRHPRAHWAKVSNERFTPPAWLDAVQEAFGPISIDPCFDPRSFVQAERTLTQDQDGLASKWAGRLAFVNPPFSDNSRWIHRCADAWQKQEVATIVALLPARIETAACHDRIFGIADVIFLRGKPKFFNEQREQMSIAPFAAMMAVWGGSPVAVTLLAQRVDGHVMWAQQAPPVASS